MIEAPNLVKNRNGKHQSEEEKATMVDESLCEATAPMAGGYDDPLRFISGFFRQLEKILQPGGEAPPSAMIPELTAQAGGGPVDWRRGASDERKMPRSLDESHSLFQDGDCDAATSPVDVTFEPYVKPGVKIVMPSEARMRRASLTSIEGGTTPRELLDGNLSRRGSSSSQSSVPTTGQFMMPKTGSKTWRESRKGSTNSISSFDRAGSAQSNMSNSSRGDGSQTSRSTTPTNVDEATLAYVHRRKQSYTETMQEKSLGARFLKATRQSSLGSEH